MLILELSLKHLLSQVQLLMTASNSYKDLLTLPQ